MHFKDSIKIIRVGFVFLGIFISLVTFFKLFTASILFSFALMGVLLGLLLWNLFPLGLAYYILGRLNLEGIGIFRKVILIFSSLFLFFGALLFLFSIFDLFSDPFILVGLFFIGFWELLFGVGGLVLFGFFNFFAMFQVKERGK